MVRLPPRLRPLFPYLKPVYTAGTRTAAPVTSRLGLPRTAVRSLAEAAATTGGRCVTARPAETLDRTPQLGVPADLPATDTADPHVGAVDAAELPGGRVLGPHRAVVTARGALVHDVSRWFGTARPREHPLYLRPRPAPPLEVPGRLAVLASRADANYYHFLFDVLPRVGVLEASGLDAPDHWYLPQTTGFQREAAELLDLGDVVDADAHPHVRAEVLVVPAPPAMTEKNPPWVVEFLRSQLASRVGVPTTRRRLYVTRGPSANNRSVTNEAEVIDLLASHGFVAIDPGAMSLADQIRAFGSAEAVVAPHGAALANLAFVPAGGAVVELFPAGCRLPDFWALACSAGLRYRYLSAPGRATSRGGALVRDITVDLDGLRGLLGVLLRTDGRVDVH
ncbi:glycosyltransferase family 61 protein [Jatrophihabitans fulvus]